MIRISTFRTAAAAACHRLAAPGMLVAALHAGAATVTGQFDFQASGFPVDAPFGTVNGTVAFSFDNAETFFGAADGSVHNGAPVHVSLGGLSLPGTWTPVLTYIKSGTVGGNPVSDLVSIGHALAGTGVNPGSDDWRLALNSASTQPAFREFTYAVASDPSRFFMTTTGQIAPVPEPGSLLLMATGLAVLGRRLTR